jgi:preprotein translocase subunit YajC
VPLDFATTTLAQGDWFVLPLLIFAIFYFVLIRPASRERKNREAQVQALKKYDRVITNAGIHGTVMGLEDDAVVLQVDDKNKVRIRFARAAIWQVLAASEEKREEPASAEESKS